MENASMALAASAPTTSAGAISTIRISWRDIPYCFMTRKTMSRSSLKRLGIAMVRPFKSANVRAGSSLRTTTALP
jgi:hypothetical protein